MEGLKVFGGLLMIFFMAVGFISIVNYFIASYDKYKRRKIMKGFMDSYEAIEIPYSENYAPWQRRAVKTNSVV